MDLQPIICTQKTQENNDCQSPGILTAHAAQEIQQLQSTLDLNSEVKERKNDRKKYICHNVISGLMYD